MNDVKTGANPKTPRGRLSYANIFQPRAQEREDGTMGPLMYSCVLIFDKEAQASSEFKAMQKAALDFAQTRWPNKVIVFTEAQWEAAVAKHGPDKVVRLRNPFRNGAEKTGEGYGPDKVFVSFSSKHPPYVVNERLQNTNDETEVYSGCYARVSYSNYSYDNKGNRGISFGLRNVQKLGDGESLSGRISAEDDFDVVDQAAASVDDEVDKLFGS